MMTQRPDSCPPGSSPWGKNPGSKRTINTELCQLWSPPFFLVLCGEMRALFFFWEQRTPKQALRGKKATVTQLLPSSSMKGFRKKKLRHEKRTGWNDSRWDLRPTPGFLTIRFTEMLELVTEVVPRVAFSTGKKCCGWTDYSKSWPFTFLNATGWTHFSEVLSCFELRALTRPRLVFFTTSLPLRGSTEDHLIYIPKLHPESKDLNRQQSQNSFSDSHVRWISPLVISWGQIPKQKVSKLACANQKRRLHYKT